MSTADSHAVAPPFASASASSPASVRSRRLRLETPQPNPASTDLFFSASVHGPVRQSRRLMPPTRHRLRLSPTSVDLLLFCFCIFGRYLVEANVQAMQFDKVEKLYKRSLEIHHAHNEPTSLEEAANERLMAVICEAKGDYEGALEHFVR